MIHTVLVLPPADPIEVVSVPTIGLWNIPIFVTDTFTNISDSTTSYVRGLIDTVAVSTINR